MEDYIIYIVKSGICLGIFLIIYALFLRKTTFFKFNRVFLLTGLIVSLIMPALKYTYDVVVSLSFVSETSHTETVAASTDQTTSISIWTILSVIYIIGIVGMFFRNIYTYSKLSKLVTNGKKIQYSGARLIENKTVASPFSFLNYIFINTSNLSQTEQNLIIKHEATHVNQKHWIDLLLCECLLLVQWFNPIVWSYIYLLKENHEYLADKAVLESGVSPALYQAVLINQEFQGPVFSFSNSFNYLKPLNRLKMMKKSKSAAWKRFTVLAIVPLFGLFLWASAEPNYIVQYQEEIPTDINESQDDTIQVFVTDVSKDKKTKPTVILRGAIAMDDKNSPLFIIDDVKKSHAEMKDINPDDIDNISVLKDASTIEKYGEEAKNGVVLIYTKKYVEQHPDKKTDKKKVNITVHKTGAKDNNGSFSFKDTLKKALIIIDGKEVTAEKFESLDASNIESISILKDASAIEVYGEKGKNGVILITTK